MKKLLPITIILIASFTFAGCIHSDKNKDTTTPTNNTTTQQETMEKTDQAPVKAEGKYVDYTPTIVQEAAAQGKKVVFFFHASWCPTCISANKDILGRLDEIPEDIIIVKTDYDTYKDLKKKYNITYQHTYVQVDANGELVTIWNGGDLDEILQRVK